MESGKINLIIGPMYSGKTSELIRRYKRYKIANKKCILVKFQEDNRYDLNKVITHDKIGFDAIKTSKLQDIQNLILAYDVICIDEVQFYPDSSNMCNMWANNGKIIEACGLNGDYNRKPFSQISNLIPLVDSLIHLTAIDKKNGLDAPFTIRLTNSNEQKLIGGSEIYEVVSRINLVKMLNS